MSDKYAHNLKPRNTVVAFMNLNLEKIALGELVDLNKVLQASS